MLKKNDSSVPRQHRNENRSIWNSNVWLLLGLGLGAFIGLLTYTQHWL